MKNYKWVNGAEYGIESDGGIKIPMWLFNPQEDLLEVADKWVLICINARMQKTKQQELEVTINELSVMTGLSNNKVRISINRLVNFGFFRNIYAEQRKKTSRLYLVNMHLNFVEIETSECMK